MRLEQLKASREAVAKATANRMLFPGSDNVNPVLLEWWLKFQTLAAKHGIPLRVLSGYRSHDEQETLYRAGRSQKRGGQSAHNKGFAIDIIHTTFAYKLPREGWVLLKQMGFEVAKSMGIKLRWGGDWDGDGTPVYEDPDENFWDAAHFEVLDWRFLEPGVDWRPPNQQSRKAAELGASPVRRDAKAGVPDGECFDCLPFGQSTSHGPPPSNPLSGLSGFLRTRWKRLFSGFRGRGSKRRGD